MFKDQIKEKKDRLVAVIPLLIVTGIVLLIAIYFMNPAPPNHLTISTGDDQSDFQDYAKQYADLLKDDGVTLHIATSKGPIENLKRLEDDKANVDVAFVPDGMGSPEKQPDVVSLGSLYYEPIWIFYRGSRTLDHVSELEGKRIAIGQYGHGTHIIAKRLLKLTGVDLDKTKLLEVDAADSVTALQRGQVDAAIFLMPAGDLLVHQMISDPSLHLMNVLQAEGINRTNAQFHHLVLPRGSLNLKGDLPREDVNILASTITLLIRDDLHPALAYLMLKASEEIFSNPGLFEKRGEFPANKDDEFPLSDDAKQFYKSGGPFWQRYLPYWLAAWFDRFVLLVIPFFAFVLPFIRTVPKVYEWRIRSRIYQRYGELKFLETQIDLGQAKDTKSFLKKLDDIERRANQIKAPKKFDEYIYSLRGHIQFVRDRIEKSSRGVS